MNEGFLKFIEDCKNWSFERITSDRMVCKGPCLVHSFIAEPTDAASAIELKLYDGENATGDLKVVLKSQYACPCCHVPLPVFFRRGLYVDLSTNATALTLHYLPLRD